jgi:ABC-type dipeptide/oligopeptide/nickel transport system permease component
VWLFFCKRVMGAVIVLVVVSFLTFGMLELAPGDAALTVAGDGASAEQLAAVRHQMGLDASMPVRYLRFMEGVVTRGDLGKSLISGRGVAGLLAERFLLTVELALLATLGALALGLAAGLVAAARPGGHLDFAFMAITGLGISLPVYWVALLLMLIFALWLHWLPAVGAGRPAHLVLPAITLALPTAAAVARLVRASVLDVKHADYVRTATAKGLPAAALWRRHIVRNGLIPVVTMLGLQLGHLLGGTFIVETLFAWPGLGRLVVQAVFDRDFPVLVGGVLLIAVIYQCLNLAADLALAWLDPRVGHEAL